MANLKIIDMPIEMVEKILKGLYVQDILNVGRVCLLFPVLSHIQNLT